MANGRIESVNSEAVGARLSPKSSDASVSSVVGVKIEAVRAYALLRPLPLRPLASVRMTIIL